MATHSRSKNGVASLAYAQPSRLQRYFGRVAKGLILAAIDEAKGAHAHALERLKKAELAARAETLIVGTGWLPAPLRVAADGSDVSAEALPQATR